MPDYDFSNVEAALIDPQLGNLRLMRDVLIRMGVKNAHPYPSMVKVQEAIASNPPDLILVDAADADSDAFKLVRWLRSDGASPNPFGCIIISTWQPTTALLNRVTNSGADDLLVKPVSPKQLMERVLSLIEARRKFVVTADYIGPDRRKVVRDGAQVPVLDAPNILRMKAMGQWDRTSGTNQIAQGMAWINHQKVIRNSIQIAFLVEYAGLGLRRTPPEKMALDHLLRVPAFIEDLLRRLKAGEESGKIITGCKAMMALIERIRRGSDQPIADPDIVQLKSLALGVAVQLNPDRAPDLLAKEVADSVAVYRTRLTQLVAARTAQTASQTGDPPAGSGTG
jgi:DNA-binding response OmpR family regulator